MQWVVGREEKISQSHGDARAAECPGLAVGEGLEIEGIFTTMDVPGSSFTVAYAINTLRQIVGFYVAGGITHGFIWY